ncbi:MAG: CcmD family protein [Cyclobacteriaceae bacterium]|nr:CcmD family protein [Cyclobacteriaceae bacterium]
MKKLSNLLIALIITTPAFSQNAEMADALRADGKIYALVAIILIIVLGLAIYLVTIDRKASRLEKRLNENKRHNS